MSTSAGYSGTPLEKKLGIKVGYRCYLHNLIDHYFDLIQLPEKTTFDDKISGKYDFIHAFFTEKNDLEKTWSTLKDALKKDGTLWISWPKGASKIEADLNGNEVRRIGLKGGLVDVKVCAVDSDWSGLKFMWRKEDR